MAINAPGDLRSYRFHIELTPDSKMTYDVLHGPQMECSVCHRTAIQVYQVGGVKRALCYKHLDLDTVKEADPEVDLV